MQHPPRRIPLSIFQSTSMAAIQKTSYFQPEQDEVQAFGGSSCSILVLFCYFRGHFKTFLGSGLIIPNEVKTGYIEDMEVSHAYPILPFRKPDGTDQPFLSPLSRYPPCRWQARRQRHSLRYQTWTSVEGCSRGIWSVQDAVQSVRQVEQARCFQQALHRSWQTRRPLMAR